MGAFENFVNNELPLRISTNEDDGTGNLPAGKILITNGIGKGTVTGDMPSGSEVLNDLNDVNAPLPSDNQILTWNSGANEWQPMDSQSSVSSIDDLSDVDTTTNVPTNGQTLVWDDINSLWKPGTISGGGGSSSPFLNAEQILLSDLKTKMANDQLDIGKYYEIQDTQTKNQAGFNINYTAQIEKLIAWAISTSEISLQVYSKDYPNDVIYFDPTVDGITGSVDGGWEDGEDWGGGTITSNWTTSTFDFNKTPIINDEFYVYHENEDNDAEWEGGDIDDTFTITDLGNGWYRFTDLTGDANFNHPDFNYGEMEFESVLLEQNGEIIYRKDPIKNIEASFDFRNVKFNRANIDINAIQLWNSGTTYNKNSLVRNSNNSIYVAMYQNSNQPLSGKYWIKLFSDASKAWFFTRSSMYYNGVNIPIDSTLKLVPVFGYFDGNTFVYNDDNINNISLFGDNNVFIRTSTNNYIKYVEINKGSNNNTLAGRCNSFNLPPLSNDNIFDWNSNINNVSVSVFFSQNIISSSVSSVSIGKITSCQIMNISESDIRYIRNSMLRDIQKSSIGNNNYYMSLNMDNGKIGNNNSYFFILSSYYCSFGNSNNHIETFNNSFSNSSFGDLNRYFRFHNGVLGLSFGVNNGKTGVWLDFYGWVRGFRIGNDCFYRGLSSFPVTVQNVVFGNNVSVINPRSMFIDCNFGTGVSSISGHNIQRVNIGNGTSQIVMPYSIYDCTWEAGLNWFQYSGNKNFRFNHISATHIDFGNSATHIGEAYLCTVYQRPDGQKKLSFIGNSDTIEVYNATD